eukprot:8116181-Ditylum_brightwellii.AAC.1
MYWKVKTYLKPENGGGLNQVDIPEWDKLEYILIFTITQYFTHMPQLQWWFTIIFITTLFPFIDWKELFSEAVSYRCVVVKEEMEKVLFAQHVQHFKQAETTPMAQPYLAQKFGMYAETEFGIQ